MTCEPERAIWQRLAALGKGKRLINVGLAPIGGVIWFAVRRAKAAPRPPLQPAQGNEDAMLRKLAHIAYGLYAAALIFPVTALAGLIVAYMKRGDDLGNRHQAPAGAWRHAGVRARCLALFRGIGLSLAAHRA
jgi:hypothetical protein